MKNLLYRIFALIFNISTILPLKENRVALLAPHPGGDNDSLGEIARYIKEKGGYEIIRVDVPRSGIKNLLSFFFIKPSKLARAKYVFLNDNFMPMADMKFSKDAVITQLWHGEGAFKRFGLMTELNEDVAARAKKCSEKLTYAICTSESVVPYYAEAFGIDKAKVLPSGSPRNDYLFREMKNKEALRKEFDDKYPECKGKKLVLYAPTFRDTPDKDKALLDSIYPKAFSDKYGDEYTLLIKLHPRIHSATVPDGAIDATALDTAKLTIICDILITDYSSICMDFALLSKPCIFYANDLDEYEAERSFCCGYKDYVPGPVAFTFEEVLNGISKAYDTEAMEKFRDFNFDYKDSNNSERVADKIMTVL